MVLGCRAWAIGHGLHVDHGLQVTDSSLFGKKETKVVTTITEWHWNVTFEWQILAFQVPLPAPLPGI